MENSAGYLSVVAKIKDLEQQLTLCDVASNECNESEKNVEKDVEAHFAKCINALAIRKAEMLQELAQKVTHRKKAIEDNRVKIKTAIEVCRDTLQVGSKGYLISPNTADVIWRGMRSIPTLRVSGRLNANLPTTLFDAIRKHGEVGDASRFFEAAAVTTLAGALQGQGDGKGMDASFDQPWGICLNPHDQCMYICDSKNNSIRKLTLQGDVSTFKTFNHSVYGIVMNHKTKCFYATTFATNTIVKFSSSGAVRQVIGGQQGTTDGVGQNAIFHPLGITIDQKSGDLFVCDQGNHLIRKITSQGEVSTLAGSEQGYADGSGKTAKFHSPRGLWYDENSQSLLVCDNVNNKLRRVQLTNGEVSTLCEIKSPACIAMTANQTIIVSTTTHFLFKVTHQGSQKYKVEALAGCGKAAVVDGGPDECCFSEPRGIAVHEESHSCFVVDLNNHAIRKVSFSTPI